MENKNVLELSEAIKLQRFKTKKTQEDCAKKLNVSIPTYRDLENNPNKLNLDQAILLGDYLDWNIIEFFLDNILQNAINK